jgi:hypothetical protein
MVNVDYRQVCSVETANRTNSEIKVSYQEACLDVFGMLRADLMVNQIVGLVEMVHVKEVVSKYDSWFTSCILVEKI